MRAQLERLMWILAVIAIFAVAATDPSVAYWLADKLMEIAQ